MLNHHFMNCFSVWLKQQQQLFYNRLCTKLQWARIKTGYQPCRRRHF